MAKYIVKENEEFEVIEANKIPLAYVLREPSLGTPLSSYVLVNSKIVITWKKNEEPSQYFTLSAKFKDVDLLKIINLKSIQEVLDTLTRFNNISEEELERLYQKALNDKKSDLEKRVEQLQGEKKELEENLALYSQIGIKSIELTLLIERLKNK